MEDNEAPWTPETANAADIAAAQAQLKEETAIAAMLKREIAEDETALDLKKARFLTRCETILKTLGLLDIESIHAHGFLFFKETKQSVQTPKTPEDKEKLFEFLKSKDLFISMVSINSQTLNSLYKTLESEATAAGILEFELPGVPRPTPYTTLKLRKG